MGAREKLAELVADSGMTQAEVARRVGEHTTWVNNRLRGTADIKANDVPRLATALGVPPEAFFAPTTAGPSAGSTERAALKADAALADAVSEAVLRVLMELSPEHRAALSDLAGRLAERQPAQSVGPEGRGEAAGDITKRIADDATRYLARAWEELPAEEQQFLWEVVEARHRLREREAGRSE